MSLAVFNGSVIRKEDLDNLNIVEGSRVTIRKNSDNSIAQVYNSNDTLDPKPNPFTADDSGSFLFWVQSGTYKIEVVTLTDVIELSNSIVTSIGNTSIKSPLDYGATGSGDETAIIQQYIDSEDNWYFPIFFTVSSKLQVTDRRITCISGAGGIIANTLNDSIIEFLRCDDSTINGFRLDMTNINPDDYDDAFFDAFRVNNSKRFTLSNSWFKGAPVQCCNFLYGCTESKIISNLILDSGTKQRKHPVSNISIGGALLIYNSAKVIVSNNIISRSWSSCIYFYGDITDQPAISDKPEKSVFSSNFLHYSQSNGLRIQDDNYPTSENSNDCVVTGNVIVDVARSSIRPNGFNHSVTGNVCTYTGSDIYGDLNLEPDGIASNHCRGGVWSGNTFNNLGASIFLVPNGLVNYGCEDLIISNNKAFDCGYLIARAGDMLAVVNNINVNNCQSFNPSWTHIQTYNTGGLQFNNIELYGKSSVVGREDLPAVRLSANESVSIDKLKTELVRDSISCVDVDKITVSNLDISSEVNGVTINSSEKVRLVNSDISFNSTNVSGATGVTVDNCDYIRISDNDFESDATETTAAILIANTDESDPLNPATPTIGHVKDNTFDALLGINNQTNQFDGDQFQQTGNIHVGELNQFETHLSPTINRNVSYIVKPRDSGKTVYFNAAGQILNIPDGLKVGYYIYVSSPVGFSVNMTGFEIINGPTVSAGANTFLIKKISTAFWQVS